MKGVSHHNQRPIHALSFDIEEYFHIHAYHQAINPLVWDSLPSTVEYNVRWLLDFLDRKNARGTFFVLGWIAERNRALVKDISARGHEIASHGYMHQTLYLHDQNHFRDDIKRSKDLLEDIIGQRILGYRAPTYSITRRTSWALQILIETGFVYDSSIFPIHHDLYGIPSAFRKPFFIAYNTSHYMEQILTGGTSPPISCGTGELLGIVEFPITTIRIGKWNMPCSGGGYFRLYPYKVTQFILKRIERQNYPFVFYLHPWEIGTRLPFVPHAGFRSHFRTKINLKSTRWKLARLLGDFLFQPLKDVLSEEGLSFWKCNKLRL